MSIQFKDPNSFINLIQAEIPNATVDSPHPKLLGRLAHVLYWHYTHGMTLDTLDFDGILSNDQLVSGEEYIDIPLDELPGPTGSNFWWEVPPSSGEPFHLPLTYGFLML